MKITITKKVFERAMNHAVGIIDRKQTVPILGYILLNASAEDNTITISSTTMDMTVVDHVKCDVEKSGSFCLPAILLCDITKKMKNDSKIVLSLDEEKNSISVTSNKTNFTIHYMESTNFPPITDASYTVQFSINSDLFKKSIDVAKVAMPIDNTRFHLNGIHMHYENDLGVNKLRFVATDLFRISCSSIIAPSEVQNMPAVIISKKTVGEVLKLIDDSGAKDIEIAVSDNRILFKLSDDDIKTEFSSRLINGTFPEYKGALDVSNDKILLVNTKEFIDAIDRVSTVVMDATNSIKLRIEQDRLVLNGVSRELGTATEDIDASFNAFESMDVCFNSRYLMEIINKIDSPQVKLKLDDSSSSTIVEPCEQSENEMQFAIMPIEIIKS